ncbi:MAG: hypothetical protein Q9226_005402 [Calogaya cf. arnoldii]
MDISPTLRGVYSTYERKPSPATSFLDNIGLGTSPDEWSAKVAEAYGNNHGQEDGNERYESRRSGELLLNNTYKRSAGSPVEELQQHEANKRLRYDNTSPNLQGQYKPRRCADAATQTEVLETASAKLALLLEEEVVAKAKHEAQMAMAQARYEAEVARRRQLMAEVEYQSKMAAWRQLSEVSSSKESIISGPTATGIASVGTSDPVRPQNFPSKTIVDPRSTVNERVQFVSTKAKAQEAPKSQTSKTQQATKGEPSTASQHEIVQSPSTSKRLPDASSKVDGPTKLATAPDTSKVNGLVKPAAAPDTSKVNGPVKPTAAPDPYKFNGPVKPTAAPDTFKAAPSSPPREHYREGADSSRSHSVQIKTSRSPPTKPRARPQADEVWAPSSHLKHLTCYFWKNTPQGCNKSAADCNYAHYDTGVTANDPEHLRRYKSGRLR